VLLLVLGRCRSRRPVNGKNADDEDEDDDEDEGRLLYRVTW
jgi:hypothetical protein